MLPAHLAENIRQQVLYYLQSTFDFRDKRVERAFERFLDDPDTGLFKGPWVHLRRPFRPAPPDVALPFDIRVPFPPFLHQWRAWDRLSSRDHHPQPTIITTGTGSGKTECFLYPILDHCRRARLQGQQGIKAIVLYPMNALAADQEKRFARAIWDDPDLKAAGIRVGNYTGRYDPADPGASADSGTKAMGPDFGITNHAVQQEYPPDILLTNYKMLDFLLMRPHDQNLWRFNEPGVLRYLVLDELHTYHGAQGADVACLIRRLKERLAIPRGELCVIGTSATLDSRDQVRDAHDDTRIDAMETPHDRLARFAETLFEESIPPEAVIGEDRLRVEEIVPPDVVDVPPPNPQDCEPREGEDALAYARRQAALWGGPRYSAPPDASGEAADKSYTAWAQALGAWLKRLTLFRHLLTIFEQAERHRDDPLSWGALVARLTRADLALSAMASAEDRHRVIVSFFALVAYAQEVRGDRAFPLAPTQVQLWIRELRRLGRVVDEAPRFAWLDEPPPGQTCLPAFHCSECGESGWVARHDPSKDSLIRARGVDDIQLLSDPAKIYQDWFGRGGYKSQYIVVISPWPDDEASLPSEGAVQQTLPVVHDYLCPASLVLRTGAGPCPLTGDSRRFRVRVSRAFRQLASGAVVGDQGCPRCGSKEGPFFIGSQAATLASVALDEMFGSLLNDDPKLLAFTDSVQDASHRAGFFTARTYHFTFRTALQHVIDAAGEPGLPLHDAGARLLAYWSQPRPGHRGSLREAMATLMPPDLQHYPPYVAFRDQAEHQEPPSTLRETIENRLTWEVTSEFGVMQTHGRTLELSGSAALGWDEARIAGTLARLRERLPGIDPRLAEAADTALRLWLYGVLHRYRQRGALEHPYLHPYARHGYWGKYPFGRALPGREAYPPMTRYRPRLIVTQPHDRHEHILAATLTGQTPWPIVWTRRALGMPQLEEASILDLLRHLLDAGAVAGLFTKLHQDGSRAFYAIAAGAAILYPEGLPLVCSASERLLVRPQAEALLWEGAPSLEYAAHRGRYVRQAYTRRQQYYQDRYRKGALRRVVAQEHTGLLSTEERENIEGRFAKTAHADDPNVLTCTSTLEMGIDIGDLSSTMLCSIPPNTANYLQRIGRAGRATGTALIVSVVNQRPHDLFFYARPSAMLKGRVEPPGCWLDASAVLVRQYLAYGFDSATHAGVLTELPRNGGQLVSDLNHPRGHIPGLLQWLADHEAELQQRFLERFQDDIQPDTRRRFLEETRTALLRQRIVQVAHAFDRARRDLVNARARLQDQLKSLDEAEQEARRDIAQELHLLLGRLRSLDRTPALEILTDDGLLPNYAFPERGVRFYGAIYHRSQGGGQEHQPVELARPAGMALRELAPHNTFYTHSRQFEIQQIAIGNPQQPLIETWAICGVCGHMRRVEALHQPGASPGCPQCGHEGDHKSQLDLGQQRAFLEFPRSQALSYMEHYDSLSGDRDEERQRELYQIIRSFDQTVEAPSGAVGDDSLPFGMEYRAAMVMREVNVGYHGMPGSVPFGPDHRAPEAGFQVCQHCGVVAYAHTPPDETIHRRSCQARRRFERLRQEGRAGDPFRWTSLYLYRELRSEAIRLLLPLVDDADMATLIACLYLGLRLRFEGDPAHLIVAPQILPEAASGLRWHYLVLLDAVPGGTGYLKTLYQAKDGLGREGEGVMEVLRRARDTLETCRCQRLSEEDGREDTDGCYRCIRAYHLQYSAASISRKRGVQLLNQIIAAGERRVQKVALTDIKPDALFGSLLEKKFVDALHAYVEQRQGTWEATIINGRQGFRFALPGSGRLWELELQPVLGVAQGVMVSSQPDFLLRCDDAQVKPVAIFTDGFEYHCFPTNRLADDLQKRRAILESGHYLVWSLTWDDLTEGAAEALMVSPPVIAQLVEQCATAARGMGQTWPDAGRVLRNGLEQLKAFLDVPHLSGWKALAQAAIHIPLQALAAKRVVASTSLQTALDSWRQGQAMPPLRHTVGGGWVYNDKASLTQDVVTCMAVGDGPGANPAQPVVLARLEDDAAAVAAGDFRERWRRFLACMNFYQFCDRFTMWTTSEVMNGTAPDLMLVPPAKLDSAWAAVRDQTTVAIRPYIPTLAAAGIPLPQVEYYPDGFEDDAFAELAWPHLEQPIAVLVGDQATFAGPWQRHGWLVVTPDDLQAKGVGWLMAAIRARLAGA
jgi:DEAD/DEAH box helicase domain-containing protein